MATFKWEISEVSDESAPKQGGGDVDLSEVRLSKGKTWEVEIPDSTVAITTVAGGVVEAKVSGAEVNRAATNGAGLLLAGRNFDRTVVMVVLVVLCAGFLAVVLKGVILGTLVFQDYTVFVLALLAAFGFQAAGSSSRTSKGQQADDSS